MRPGWREVTIHQQCMCAWCEECAADSTHAEGCELVGDHGSCAVLTTRRECAENGLVPGAAVLNEPLQGLTWQLCESACRTREVSATELTDNDLRRYTFRVEFNHELRSH
jgi:hypothetical protein